MIPVLTFVPAAFFTAIAGAAVAAGALPVVIPPKAPEVAGHIQEIEVGPIFAAPFACTEHYFGELLMAGDALGTDCWVLGGLKSASGFARSFRTDGKTNEDWYGWHAEVLSPVKAKVIGVLSNPVQNMPGTMGKPPAGMVQLLRSDGIGVIVAHVTDPTVKVGDHVEQGDVIGRVGNNGYARAPHIHVGAYRFRTGEALQIRWDLRAMARLQQDF